MQSSCINYIYLVCQVKTGSYKGIREYSPTTFHLHFCWLYLRVFVRFYCVWNFLRLDKPCGNTDNLSEVVVQFLQVVCGLRRRCPEFDECPKELSIRSGLSWLLFPDAVLARQILNKARVTSPSFVFRSAVV